MSYKQTILDIEDFISLELATIERELDEGSYPNDILTQKRRGQLEGAKWAYEDVRKTIEEGKNG